MRKFKKIVAILLVVAALIAACAVMAACDKGSTPATFAKAGESSDGYATIYVPDDRDVKIMVLSDPKWTCTKSIRWWEAPETIRRTRSLRIS